MDDIVGDNRIRKYLDDWKNDRIKLGLGIGIDSFDNYIRFKDSQLNVINGHDNTGKTVWILWYFLCLAVKHGKRFVIWSGENKAEALVRQLIQFKKGFRFKTLSDLEIINEQTWISHHFKFIENNKLYKPKELFDIFNKHKSDACLIDPYTGLDRDFSHAGNYEFLNYAREFSNSTGMSTYINTHPDTKSARTLHTKDSAKDDESLIGYPKPPLKSQSEGGQVFANRVDDFITIHRYAGHPLYNFKTQVYSRKIKDTDTGGQVMAIDEPEIFDWNKGLGFTCDGVNPLSNTVKEDLQFEDLDINDKFEDDSPF